MLDKIIESCKYVSDISKHVTIDNDKLNSFVKQISDVNMKNWLSDSPFGLLDLSSEQIVNFLLVYESIDFSFWGNPKWTIQSEEGTMDGSIALLYILLKYVKENNTTDFSKIGETNFYNILKGSVEIPLLHERFNIIKEVSKIVNEKMNGNFYKYIEKINTSDELFELIINNFPNFKDERIYNGQTIYFYKLAQLLTSDILHIREIKENIKVDCSHLVGCADYKIPQVLRALGILVYDDELSNIVDNKIEIDKNSEYEIEIRANMLVVVNRICKLLNNKYNSIDINDYLFMQKNNKSLSLKPYHLIRNINY